MYHFHANLLKQDFSLILFHHRNSYWTVWFVNDGLTGYLSETFENLQIKDLGKKIDSVKKKSRNKLQQVSAGFWKIHH